MASSQRARLLIVFAAWAASTAQAPPSATFYATYLGGAAADTGRDIAVDGQGYVYVTGGTMSADFPTTASAYDRSQNGSMDAFLSKFAPDGTLVYSTFLGGPNYDRAYAIELDSLGNVYIAGRAGAGFPTTAGVLQPTFGGDVVQNTFYGAQDGFVAKFSSAGALQWSTYFGGDDRGIIRDIAVDAAGDVYLAASGMRPNPRITAGVFQPTIRGGIDGLVAKISSDGRRVIYATFVGGSGDEGEAPSLRVDSQGYAYFLTETNSVDLATTPTAYQRTRGGGQDWLLAKISPDATRLQFLTYFGRSGDDFVETHNLSLDGAGNPLITAQTLDSTLPTTPTAFQRTHHGNGGSGTGAGTNYAGEGYIAKLSTDGSQLLAATFLGGSAGEAIEGSFVDSAGNVYVTGGTFSSDFPVTTTAMQSVHKGTADIFLAKLSPDLSQLLYSTYIGGNGGEVGRCLTVDAAGNMYVSGETNSVDFPFTANALDRTYGGNDDSFMVRHPSVGTMSARPSPPTNLRIVR